MIKIAIALFAMLAAGPAAADPISGLAAIGTAFGASAGAAVMTGLMITGTAISAVGAITGNKKLAKFGSLVGLAGGIGAGIQALTSAATTVAETSAGTAALSQTAAPGVMSPAAEVAAEGAVSSGVPSSAGDVVARGLNEAPSALVDGAAAGGATAPSALTPAAQAMTPGPGAVEAASSGAAGAGNGSELLAGEIGTSTGSPVADALRTASKHVGSFIKDNKELVQLGSGLISGAMNRGEKADLLQQQIDYEDRRRAEYNAGIQGSRIPFQVRGDVNVNNVPPRDPMRYVPQRGLINQQQGA